MIIPNTTIRLLKCPLQLDNKNQITFRSKEQDQYSYFLSLPYVEIDASYYQRANAVIYWPDIYDNLIQYNYCMYQNSNYNNKWFFAFVTGMKYVSDNCTLVSIVEDVYQTWSFDTYWLSSFVEREMLSVNDDVPGANLVPENLETGEYKIGGTASVTGLNPYYIWAYSGDHFNFGATGQYPSLDVDLTTKAGRLFVNGIHTGLNLIVATTDIGYAYVDTALKIDNQSEYVVAHFSVPSLACNNNLTLLHQDRPGVYIATGKATATTKSLSARPSSIDGYTPRNKKVLQYPYLYVGFNPRNGSPKIYRYEDFTNATPSFKLISEINPNPTAYVIPQNYRGKTGDNINDSATLNGFPQVASRVDVYNSWLAENSGIINVQQRQASTNYELDTYNASMPLLTGIGQMIGSGGQIIEGGSGGDDVGSVNSGFTQTIGSAIDVTKLTANYGYYIQMLNAQKEKQALLPDNVTMGASNATLLGYELLDDDIFTQYNIKSQFARRIDTYFDVFGYQTNEFKTPNTWNRKYWNYVKTQGANITGDMPQEAVQTLKLIFDNGITLWHDVNHFLDYSQNNRE